MNDNELLRKDIASLHDKEKLTFPNWYPPHKAMSPLRRSISTNSGGLDFLLWHPNVQKRARRHKMSNEFLNDCIWDRLSNYLMRPNNGIASLMISYLCVLR